MLIFGVVNDVASREVSKDTGQGQGQGQGKGKGKGQRKGQGKGKQTTDNGQENTLFNPSSERHND